MKKAFAVLGLLCACAAAAQNAQVPAARVAEDARVIDRVAEASRKDLPDSVLKRIVNEDIDLLRGKRADGSYEFATYERFENGRLSDSYSVQPRKENELQKAEIKGSWVYRLIVSSPSRRMLVTRNRRVFIDRVDLEYIPQASSTTKRQSFKIEAWLEPGAERTIDFPEVARQATARVLSHADTAAGYGNLVLTLYQAKIVDNADSPYADAVASLKALTRAIESSDIKSIRAMAARIEGRLGERPPNVTQSATNVSQTATNVTQPASPSETTSHTVDVVASRSTAASQPDPVVSTQMYSELQDIEDMLTGPDQERRLGLDKLHQLIRRLRPAR